MFAYLSFKITYVKYWQHITDIVKYIRLSSDICSNERAKKRNDKHNNIFVSGFFHNDRIRRPPSFYQLIVQGKDIHVEGSDEV